MQKNTVPPGTEACFRGTTRNSPDSALYTDNGVNRPTLLKISGGSSQGKALLHTANGSQHPVLSGAVSAQSDGLIIAFLLSAYSLSHVSESFNT